MAAKPAQKFRQEHINLLILLGVAALLIGIGYSRLGQERAAPSAPNATETLIAIDNTTVISQPLETDEGCPLYDAEIPQLFTFQLLRKDKTENIDLLYSLHYRCDCGPDCAADCGAEYEDLTGSMVIPILRFSDNDVMELFVQGQLRETFKLKCTKSQTIIYLTDEQCEFTYDCSFFDKLMGERLPYEALRDHTCDAILRNCDAITVT